MAKTLVLAEKPSVARELARVLGCKQSGEGYLEGEKYIVTWALGHLVELAPPEDYDKAWAKWDMLTLPMLPERMKTVVIPQSGRQFRAVQAQLRRGDVGELVIATDAGREGELVARWILEKAGWKGPAKRLWISSQTDKAIREGFAHLRPAAEYDNLFRSARALPLRRAAVRRAGADPHPGHHCGAGGGHPPLCPPGVLDGHREAARFHRHLAGSERPGAAL